MNTDDHCEIQTTRVHPVELTWRDGRNALVDPAKVSAITMAKEAKWGSTWLCWLVLDGGELVWSFRSKQGARDHQNHLMVKLGWLP